MASLMNIKGVLNARIQAGGSAPLVDNGQSIAAAARTLGVADQTLFDWVKAQSQGKLKGAGSKAPVSAELARVKMDRHILLNP